MHLRLTFAISVLLSLACGSKEETRPAVYEPIAQTTPPYEAEKITKIDLSYTVVLSESSSLEMRTLTVGEEDEVSKVMAQLDARGAIQDIAPAAAAINSVRFYGEDGQSVSVRLISRTMIEYETGGVQEVAPTFVDWANQAASHHDGETVNVLIVNERPGL